MAPLQLQKAHLDTGFTAEHYNQRFSGICRGVVYMHQRRASSKLSTMTTGPQQGCRTRVPDQNLQAAVAAWVQAKQTWNLRPEGHHHTHCTLTETLPEYGDMPTIPDMAV